jgi:hypothetical protein
LTVFYESDAEVMTAKSYEEYEQKMNRTNAGGGTYFGAAF